MLRKPTIVVSVALMVGLFVAACGTNNAVDSRPAFEATVTYTAMLAQIRARSASPSASPSHIVRSATAAVVVEVILAAIATRRD